MASHVDGTNPYTGYPYDDVPNYRTETRTKKGLQDDGQDYEIYEDLGINYSLYNVCLDSLVNGDTLHTYQGKTYSFSTIPDLPPEKVAAYNQRGVSVGVVLLMRNAGGARTGGLIYSGAQNNFSHDFYAWNVYDPAAQETLEALFDFLAKTYGTETCHIDDWVVGNEVNMPNDWNFTGTLDLNTNVDIAARSLIMVERAIKRYNSGARAYLSLDHCWTIRNTGIAGKTFLDAYGARIEELAPGIDWNIAYHPYAPYLPASNIWDSSMVLRLAPQELDAKYISTRNLSVFTEYVKEQFGSDCRIILSEQGFSAYGGQEFLQAAALCYTYYAAEFNDMVDATMFRSLRDASEEMKSRLYFGLIGSNGTPRIAYDVFKYMDTSHWPEYTLGCLETMGIDTWNEYVEGFNPDRFIRQGVSEVILDSDGMVLPVGYESQITYSVYPEFAETDQVVWSSSDPSVISVDPQTGVLRGLSPGRSIITISAGGVEYNSLIVVVVTEEEALLSIAHFVAEVYENAWDAEIDGEALDSYVGRLLTKHMTAVDVVYEILNGRLVSEPCESTREEVYRIARTITGLSDQELVEEYGEEWLEKYIVCIDGGMDKGRLMADLFSDSFFDYRAYDANVETGYAADIPALLQLTKQSWNRKMNTTYHVIHTYQLMLGRNPETWELEKYTTLLIQHRLNASGLVVEVSRSEEFQQQELSEEAYVEMLNGLLSEPMNGLTMELMEWGLNHGIIDRMKLLDLFFVEEMKE
ncbi:MAG: Ig-like domain-containing protein [Lachnospiraceae bacterium]|nr:Ig-like domain-containing protein [Lachnospiraceae bacterium]